MKRSHLFLAIVISAVVIGVVASRRSVAQTASAPGEVVMQRLERLVTDLTQSGQTNALAQVNSLISAMQTLNNTKDAGMTVALLERLRSGRTDEVIGVLETQLDGTLLFIGTRTNEIGEAQIKVLQMAKQYRAKFPHKGPSAEGDAAVARAFELLDKK